MRRKGYIVTLVVLTSMVAACSGGDVPPTSSVEPTPMLEGKVVDVVNEVDAHPLPEGEWEDAVADMAIYQGGEVWAQEASTARVDVEEKLVRVAPNTIFTLGQPEPDTVQLNLEEGQVWLNVEGLERGETFQVETPSAVASVRGTRFSVRVDAHETTIVSTQVGTVTVAAEMQVVTVTSGLQTEVLLGEPPEEPVPMSPQEELRWGLASGPDLDVVLPVIDCVDVFTYTGNTFSKAWSPDGRYFALSSSVGGVIDTIFYDWDTHGTIPSPLGFNSAGVFYNPAGDGFAYQSFEGPITIICTGHMESSHSRCFGGDGVYGWPYWSPDGEWILFYSNRGHSLTGGDFNLFKARPDGSDMTPLTSGEGVYNIRQSWSPDGDSIAFVSAKDYGGPGDVWVMGADGSNPVLVFGGVYGDGYNHIPWSPDGSALAVPGVNGGLWLAYPDGSPAQVMTATTWLNCSNPVWSPTDDGWPLLFNGVDPANDEAGLWALTDAGAEPRYIGNPDWGPLYGSGRVAFGYTDLSSHSLAEPVTSVYLFKTEDEFW